MKRNVATAQASMEEVVLPERVQEALGQLVGAAKEGLLALSVGVGLGVLAELLEEEVDEVVGPKGKWDPERTAVRHGHESGEVTLGGRRVQVERPRVRTVDGQAEVRLATYEHFADRDPLARVVMERMLASVSTRRRSSRSRTPTRATAAGWCGRSSAASSGSHRRRLVSSKVRQGVWGGVSALSSSPLAVGRAALRISPALQSTNTVNAS